MSASTEGLVDQPRKHGRWKSLFDGREASQLRGLALEIEAHVRAASAHDPRREDPTLAGGNAGAALLHTYSYLVTSDDDARDSAVGRLEAAFDGIERRAMGPGLMAGLTGIAWTATHVERVLFGRDECLVDPQVDEYLVQAVKNDAQDRSYDLVSGLIGIGLYFLDRPLSQVVLDGIDAIIEVLEATATPADDGLTWITPAALLPETQRRLAPDGYFNLGMAHGVPGIIAFLAAAHRAEIQQERCQRLIAASVEWLRRQQIPASTTTSFPAWHPVGGRDSAGTRVAWCYGDLGISCSLLSAGLALSDESICRWATELARGAAGIDSPDACIEDAALCHGASGAAHLFNRLYQATGDASLADAARSWYRTVPERRTPGRSASGFLYCQRREGRTDPWVQDSGFLTGDAGLALAILAATSPVLPEWDRALLVDLPVRDDRARENRR